MALISLGSPAPALDLEALAGGRFRLAPAARGQLLFFFRADCPVCQLSAPLIGRLARAAAAADARRGAEDSAARGARVVGVSQDAAAPTREFLRRCALEFPVALDSPPGYAASRAFGLTHVPSLFWVDAGGVIRKTVVGFDRADFEALAELAGAAPLFTAADAGLPAHRPG